VRASPGLAQDRFFVEVQAQAARRAVGNAPAMPPESSGITGSMSRWRFTRGLKIGDCLGTGRMLQIEERAAVRDRRHQRAHCSGSHRDALAKRAHLADAAKFGGDFHFRIRPQLFAGIP